MVEVVDDIHHRWACRTGEKVSQRPCVPLNREEAAQLRVAFEKRVERLQRHPRALHDLAVCETNNPPALARDVVLAPDKIVEVATLLELPEAVHFDDELARAFESEVHQIRSNAPLWLDIPQSRVAHQRRKHFANELDF